MKSNNILDKLCREIVRCSKESVTIFQQGERCWKDKTDKLEMQMKLNFIGCCSFFFFSIVKYRAGINNSDVKL